MVDETFVIAVGARLREARNALGLDQAEVAALVGVTRVQWGRYERGIGVPGGEVLGRAAAAGIDILYVITGSREFAAPPPITPRARALLDNYAHASEEGQRTIERVADLAAQSKCAVRRSG